MEKSGSGAGRSGEQQTTSSLPYLLKHVNESKVVNPCRQKLDRAFFDTPTETLAINLLGKLLCRQMKNGEILCGRIVETESYLGEIDSACHSYGGKRTQKNEAMYAVAGTAYVYTIYGMYHCFNISSQDNGACVLVRAIEPITGLETMRTLRSAKRKAKSLKDHEIASGPSKLCIALNINKVEQNHTDLVTCQNFWLEHDQTTSIAQVIYTKRIGIDSYGKEASEKLYRYYILGNTCVSKRDKKAENTI